MRTDKHELRSYRAIWLVDFEYHQPPGALPSPICMVAIEFVTGQVIKLCKPFPLSPPFDCSREALFVAYFAPAELSCFLALQWAVPANVLDLYAEFRVLNSGITLANGVGLLGALAHFGITGIKADEKETLRELAIRGGPFTDAEIAALLEYCETDVVALTRLLRAMNGLLDFPRCLIRGEYTKVVAAIEYNGIPIDADLLGTIKENWPSLRDRLVQKIDVDYGVFTGTTFKSDRFEQFLGQHNISWPRLESGRAATDDETFKTMSQLYPMIAPLRELRRSLAQTKANDLAVGPDRRHRFMVSPFGGKTGRNQPSTTRFIFGGPAYLRNLIAPEPGTALSYIDYEQQEFGIAACLSNDANMIEAYVSGDPYLKFAIMAQRVPADATKSSHRIERELFKSCALGVQYGMQADSLALRINRSPAHGRELLELHRRMFRQYWHWSDCVQDHAMIYGKLTAAFGWPVHVGPNANPRSLRNFPLQANGAEMLRLACILAYDRKVRICAPVHDALLVEAPAENIEEAVLICRQSMADASAAVLDGFRLRTDARIIRPDERFNDPRGDRMWKVISELIPHHGPN